ncbi:MAG: CAAX prenyl protease-related protein [Nitrospirae bacterium]|nr:CAAX prenyl protease-related protein [Nitrospirota bacterium]
MSVSPSTTHTQDTQTSDSPKRNNDFQEMWPRIIPFVAYMSFIAVGSLLTWFLGEASSARETADLWLYPVKTLVVATLLYVVWSRCPELQRPICPNMYEGALAVGVGLVVYALWVRMDWAWATQGEIVGGYNPFVAGSTVGMVLAGIRIFGASIIVPLMEELFWRSFLLRYVINSRFETIPLGVFTVASFGITVILFGLEHNLWLAGMMAGAAYTLLIYHTKRLWPCIVAHGVTNLALGIHVLVTGEWQWW